MINVEYIDHMGDDLRVADVARVSFDKKSKWDLDENGNEQLSAADSKLIHYLAAHNHWSPFAHCILQVRVSVPIFVARQLFKHKVGLVENEISRRYVDTEPHLFIPREWRGRAANKKQGSSDERIEFFHYVEERMCGPQDVFEPIDDAVLEFYDEALSLYEKLIDANVCPEQARMVLPQSMMTSYYWTGSLAAYARVAKLRLDPDVQVETREAVEMIAKICEGLWPVSWNTLME